MRADLERIKKMIDAEETNGTHDEEQEIAILRELLTSWQAMTANEYSTDNKLHLNMLTKRMLQDEEC